MTFFKIVLLLVAVLYVWGFTSTVRRFYREVILIRSVGHRVERLHLSFLHRWVAYLLLFALAPLVRYRLIKLDEQAEEERRERRRQQEREEQEWKLQENIRRAEARKQWLAENPLKLYCKTVAGITAVVRPSEYEACQVQTRKARRNEQWTEERILMPIESTFLFVNTKGAALYSRNCGTSNPLQRLNGWFSDLDDLVEMYNITLETKEDIFVPYLNEALLPFGQHLDAHRENYSYQLTGGQAPPEMQPVN